MFRCIPIMSRIVVLTGSMRKGGNTDLLARAFAEGAGVNHDVEIISVALIYAKLSDADIVAVASPVYFYGISSQLKAVIDRLHTPMRTDFKIKKLALLLVGAASLPELFDAIKMQYRLILDFFNLEDAGMVLVRGVKDKGDIKENEALKEAYNLGLSMK